MEQLAIPAALVAVTALLGLFVWNARRRNRGHVIGVRPRRVLDGAPAHLYRTLCAGLPNHHVLARVPFSDFMEPRKGHSGLQAALAGYRADFLVCDSSFGVVAVIDAGSEPRDAKRDALLRDAALPLIRWPANQAPDASEVRETIRDLESLRTLSESLDAPADPGVTAARPDAGTTASEDGGRREPHL